MKPYYLLLLLFLPLPAYANSMCGGCVSDECRMHYCDGYEMNAPFREDMPAWCRPDSIMYNGYPCVPDPCGGMMINRYHTRDHYRSYRPC